MADVLFDGDKIIFEGHLVDGQFVESCRRIERVGERSLTEELKIEANHADHMADMARAWMEKAQAAERRIEDMQRVAAAIILAVGGEVVVRNRDLLDAGDHITLIREDDPALLGGIRYRVERNRAPPVKEKRNED